MDQEAMDKEVRAMIASGLLPEDWARGLDEREAENRFRAVLANNPSYEPPGQFDSEERNREVREMIAKGLLDADWADGIDQQEADRKFQRALSNDPGSGSIVASPFDDEEMNDEVQNMIKLGLLEPNWAQGVDHREAKRRFNQALSNNPSSVGQNTERSYGNPTHAIIPSQTSNSLLKSSGATKSSPAVKKSTRPSTGRAKNYKLIPLNPDDEIFKDIYADFKYCIRDREVKAIQRVENKKREKLFEDEKSQLESLHGTDFDLHIQDLYHGSNAPRNLICSRGLDQRVGTIGIFGRGIYFSDNVKKCSHYLTNTKGSAIYKCSVILGDIKEYPNGEADPQLKQEPEKEDGEFYDSVKGNVDSFNQFVIYDNRRCLIKYRIVLEGTEDEDSDIEEEVEKADKEEEMFEIWKRHMNFMVKHCPHEDEIDPQKLTEIQNIEKIRLEIRRRREIQTGSPLTEVTYTLLQEERKKWLRQVNRNTRTPPEQMPCDERRHLVTNRQDSFPDIPMDDDPVQLVLDKTLSEFIEFTNCQDIELAKGILANQNWSLDGAINEYLSIIN